MIQTPKGFATSLPVKHVTPRLATRIGPQRYSPSAPSVARTLGSNSASNHGFLANHGWLRGDGCGSGRKPSGRRSEEHTSELQSLMRISYAVFCLKKKKSQNTTTQRSQHRK